MAPRPKTYTAVIDFSCAGEHYTAGDAVPAGVALTSALRHGDRFVTASNTKRGQAAQDSTPTTTNEEAS